MIAFRHTFDQFCPVSTMCVLVLDIPLISYINISFFVVRKISLQKFGLKVLRQKFVVLKFCRKHGTVNAGTVVRCVLIIPVGCDEVRMAQKQNGHPIHCIIKRL